MQEATSKRRLAAIEAGGTKFVCAVGSSADAAERTVRIETRDPDQTLAEAAAFLREAAKELGPIDGLGIASFGPVQVNPAAPDYGRILATPKPGWEAADILGRLCEAAACPGAIDTDVNAAALAEARHGAAQGCADVVYITVGTGIGAGIVSGGAPVHGLLHPEAGHLRLRRHPADLEFSGICPFHGDCCEGLASGPAIAARSGMAAEALGPDHPHWGIVAHQLGELCASLVLSAAPQRIVLGGGVMSGPELLPKIRAAAAAALGGYLVSLRTPADFERLIVAPGCTVPGLEGAFLLAERAAA